MGPSCEIEKKSLQNSEICKKDVLFRIQMGDISVLLYGLLYYYIAIWCQSVCNLTI